MKLLDSLIPLIQIEKFLVAFKGFVLSQFISIIERTFCIINLHRYVTNFVLIPERHMEQLQLRRINNSHRKCASILKRRNAKMLVLTRTFCMVEAFD